MTVIVKNNKRRRFYQPSSGTANKDFLWDVVWLLCPQCGWMTSSILIACLDEDFGFFVNHPGVCYTHLSILEAASVRQVFALFSKNASVKLKGVNTALATYQNFLDCEAICKEYNDKLYSERCYTTVKIKKPDGQTKLIYIPKAKRPIMVQRVISTAAEIIKDILGDCPELPDLIFKFGPGASTTVSKIIEGGTTPRFKLDAEPTCGRDALQDVETLWSTIPYYAFLHKGKVRVSSCVYSSVPKNAKIERSILTDCLLNMPVQKGIGGVIRSRFLRNAGIDLRHAADVNKSAAREASIKDDESTIDFISASGLICFELVSLLLPMDWFNLLAKWRTPDFLVPLDVDRGIKLLKTQDPTLYLSYQRMSRAEKQEFCSTRFSVQLQQFSGMGNGFTFELESVIFYALAKASQVVYEGNYSHSEFKNCVSRTLICGDDLILNTRYVPLFLKVSTYVGFRVNYSKSYFKGNFRESCGGDFLKGINVRPFYIKDVMTSARAVGFLNYCKALGVNVLNDKLHSYIINYIPRADRLFGHSSYGDGHIHCDDYPYGYVKDNDKRGFNLHAFFSFKKQVIVNDCSLARGDELLYLYNTMFIGVDDDFRAQGDPYVTGASERPLKVRICEFGVKAIFRYPACVPSWYQLSCDVKPRKRFIIHTRQGLVFHISATHPALNYIKMN